MKQILCFFLGIFFLTSADASVTFSSILEVLNPDQHSDRPEHGPMKDCEKDNEKEDNEDKEEDLKWAYSSFHLCSSLNDRSFLFIYFKNHQSDYIKDIFIPPQILS